MNTPFVPSVVCADCPEEACCPWVPAASNPLSVTTAADGDTVSELSMLTMKSCYKSPPHHQVAIQERPTASTNTVAHAVHHDGGTCHVQCGGKTGACPDFCGPLGACCRVGFTSNDPEGDGECLHGKLGCAL